MVVDEDDGQNGVCNMAISLQKVLIRFLAIAALLWMGASAAFAANFSTQARHAILIDAGTGEVLFEKSPDALMPPASMSKLMTMVMVFEALKRRQLTLDDKFFVSENAWKNGGATSGGSTMYAKVNSDVKLQDLIRGVIVQSANDACIAIAEGLSGSEEAFGEAMTKRARELGLEKSNFTNATGLPDPEHKMTARELAKLARHIIYELPEYYKYYAEREFTWNKITQQNRNPLLYMDIGADGLKTGFTREAGYGLVASAVRDGRRLIMVIAGMKSSKARRVEARKLLDWGFRRFRSFVLFQRGQTVGHARVWGGTEGWVQLMSKEPVRVMLTPQERKSVRAEVVYDGPLQAPIQPGAQIGKLRFAVEGSEVSEVPLFVVNSVDVDERPWKRALDTIKFMIFGG